MVNNKFYAGIGSRSTPDDIKSLMFKCAVFLGNKGYTLRSGGAFGSDSAHESGCDLVSGLKEIYLPWPFFNNNPSPLYLDKFSDDIILESWNIAENFHPAWDKLSNAARKFMIRNTFQVLGKDLKTPSKFIICWTKDGKSSGGTGQALRIAEFHKIKIYNLFYPEVRKCVENKIAYKTENVIVHT